MTFIARLRKQNDSAVSPVIAVILMVAITVVLAATVYVWVSGFGSQSTQPAKTVSLTSAGSLTTGATLDTTDAADTYKPYTVAAATTGMRYGDITFTLDGTTATLSTGNCDATLTDLASNDGGVYWIACSGAFGASATARTATSTVAAGDYFYLMQEGSSIQSKTLRVLDAQANSVILTLTVG